MIERQIEIVNKLGLHARAAAKLVATASRFACRSELEFGGVKADTKSIMSVMMLAATKGSVVTLRCEGDDEDEALQALRTLINNYFEEDQ